MNLIELGFRVQSETACPPLTRTIERSKKVRLQRADVEVRAILISVVAP